MSSPWPLEHHPDSETNTACDVTFYTARGPQSLPPLSYLSFLLATPSWLASPQEHIAHPSAAAQHLPSCFRKMPQNSFHSHSLSLTLSHQALPTLLTLTLVLLGYQLTRQCDPTLPQTRSSETFLLGPLCLPVAQFSLGQVLWDSVSTALLLSLVPG